MTTLEGTGYADGYAAARAGESVAACPFGPAEPEGAKWRQGWLNGEATNREQAGTFDHTPDEYAAYKASIGWSPEALRDPVVEILGGYDPLPSTSEPWLTPEMWDRCVVAFQVVADDFKAAFVAVADALNNAFSQIDLDALSALADSLQGIVPAAGRESPKVQARRREVQLLAHHRRSHRRTNRWGPRPGR